MKMMLTIAAVAAAPVFAQPAPAPPAPTVEIRSGPDGQMTGRVTNGGIASDVQTGRPAVDPRNSGASPTRCPPGSVGRNVRVVSPDGASMASSSVSTSGNGVASVAGAGSPGSRIIEERCGTDPAPKDGAAHARARAPH